METLAVPRVVLDACVLYRMYLRDTLLRCAEAGLFMPVWSAAILRELAHALRERQSRVNADRIISLMTLAFPEANVRVSRSLSDHEVAHVRDRHVVCAALAGDAGMLVTFNTRHFDSVACAALGVRLLTPDEFLCSLAEAESVDMCSVLARQAAAYDRPPMTARDLIAALRPMAPTFGSRMTGTAG